MDGPEIVIAVAADARGGNQINTLFRGLNVLFGGSLDVAAEWAGRVVSGRSRERSERLHRLANHFAWPRAYVGRQGAVHPQNLVSTVVHHDEVADGINIFNPLPFRLFDLREAQEVRAHGWPGRGPQANRHRFPSDARR